MAFLQYPHSNSQKNKDKFDKNLYSIGMLKTQNTVHMT